MRVTLGTNSSSRRGILSLAVITVFAVLLGSAPQPAEGQFFRALRNFFRPFANAFRPRFVDDGTQTPQATGRDEILPSDCGRDPDAGTGKLCFPDGLLCQNRKFRYEIPLTKHVACSSIIILL